MGFFNSSLAEIDSVIQTLNPIVTKIVIALIILLLGFILGKLIGTIIFRVLQAIEIDNAFFRIFGIKLKVEHFISGIFSFLVYLLAVVLALNQVNLLSLTIQLLSYIVVIAIIISIILGLRNIIPNFVAGLVVKKKLSLFQGNKINIGEIKGRIVNVNSIYVYIETIEKDLISVPFSYFLKEKTRIFKKNNELKNKTDKTN